MKKRYIDVAIKSALKAGFYAKKRKGKIRILGDKLPEHPNPFNDQKLEKNKMPKLKFRDLRERKAFMLDKYKLVSKKTKRGMTYFAVTKAPSGTMSSTS